MRQKLHPNPEKRSQERVQFAVDRRRPCVPRACAVPRLCPRLGRCVPARASRLSGDWVLPRFGPALEMRRANPGRLGVPVRLDW